MLIDKILDFELGKQLRAVKNVSMAEEYLSDHFPIFPVLPGVFLLQGLIESASWLVRKSENFAHSMVLLTEAKNVKYKSFAAPSMKIEYTVTAKMLEENLSSFTGKGVCGDKQIVEARIGLRHFNLSDADSSKATQDAYIIESLKRRFELLKN
ncbi:MAG: hypothetical protein K8R02_08640 [Anaerohalosphaeraceae bacterium]|nr:hypothetical protein [Anaerohalosphaeraceae bacterium]